MPSSCAASSIFSTAAATDCTLQISATRSSTDKFPAKSIPLPSSLDTITTTGASRITFTLLKAPLINLMLSGKNGSWAFTSRFRPRSMTRASSSLASPRTTVKCQGCRFLEEGAAMPASRIVCRSISDMESDLNFRMLRRSLIAFNADTETFFSPSSMVSSLFCVFFNNYSCCKIFLRTKHFVKQRAGILRGLLRNMLKTCAPDQGRVFGNKFCKAGVVAPSPERLRSQIGTIRFQDK